MVLHTRVFSLRQVAKSEFSDSETFEELRRFSSLYPHPNVLPFRAMCTRFRHEDFVGKVADEAIMVPFYEYGSLQAYAKRFRELHRCTLWWGRIVCCSSVCAV